MYAMRTLPSYRDGLFEVVSRTGKRRQIFVKQELQALTMS
jgi:hypothetical protein